MYEGLSLFRNALPGAVCSSWRHNQDGEGCKHTAKAPTFGFCFFSSVLASSISFLTFLVVRSTSADAVMLIQ
jgi:hypothetical protein